MMEKMTIVFETAGAIKRNSYILVKMITLGLENGFPEHGFWLKLRDINRVLRPLRLDDLVLGLIPGLTKVEF